MRYSLAILWHERQRFLPAVLAVAFSALLIALQCGLLLGIFSITSLVVDSSCKSLPGSSNGPLPYWGWLGCPSLGSSMRTSVIC